MTPDEWRQRVGRHIEARRGTYYRSMRKAASAAGISESTWRMLESGRRQLAPGNVIAPSPADDTQLAVTAVLRWPPDALDRLANGEDPAQFPTWPDLDQPTTVETAIGADRTISDDARELLLAAYRAARARGPR